MVGTLAVPLSWYLILGAGIFCVGVYGVLASRNLILTMMSLELMLNAVVLNFVAFARFLEPTRVTGKTFAIIVYALAAGEAALGLALIISIWRTENTVEIEEVDILHG
ncbi:MAG: NADH-quinone oxidoreductase subunit NuoK [Anaerolineae bacterium]|nr:NADH-quinone oxidoreductase subunit NuoK [Anaerolineae bacterium]